nr:hypothetical protein [Paenibacillus sp. FSL A5-0031]
MSLIMATPMLPNGGRWGKDLIKAASGKKAKQPMQPNRGSFVILAKLPLFSLSKMDH